MFERQNDSKGMSCLKASVYCYIKQQIYIYTNLAASLSLFVLGIFNRYYMFIDTRIMVLLSGAILLISTFLSAQARKARKERATLLEMFDIHVYGIPGNDLISKKLSSIVVEHYASKIKDKKNTLKNYYFKNKDIANSKHSVFENQYKQFAKGYKMLSFVKSFFYIIWIGFLVGMVAVSISINDSFLNTLVNILVPSLSTIMLIINSWTTLHSQIGKYQHGVGVLQKYKTDSDKGGQNLNSPMFLRSIQDAVYDNRCTIFLVPRPLQRLFERNEQARSFADGEAAVPAKETKSPTPAPQKEAKKTTARNNKPKN